jgi:hypothetical protein
MRTFKFLILLPIIGYCLISCQLSTAQSGFHRLLSDANENFLQSAGVFLKPMLATFGKSAFSSNCNCANKNNAVEKIHFQPGRRRDVNKVVQLSASSFQNEKFITTGFSIPGNLTNRWKLTLTMNYDWAMVKANVNGASQIHMSDYNINATQTFRLSKDFSLKLTGRYSSIGFLPPY